MSNIFIIILSWMIYFLKRSHTNRTVEHWDTHLNWFELLLNFIKYTVDTWNIPSSKEKHMFGEFLLVC